jgi:hypothetical protein
VEAVIARDRYSFLDAVGTAQERYGGFDTFHALAWILQIAGLAVKL